MGRKIGPSAIPEWVSQSATAATGQSGQEGRILRFVFWHSVALAVIMGIIVMLQAYVFPWMVP